MASGSSTQPDDALIQMARMQIDAIPRDDASHRSSETATTGVAAWPDQLSQRYEIRSEIHRGGQGVVYHGVHRPTRREVAIKLLRSGPFAGARERARFDREAEILASLRHPNIVTIHDSGEAAGCSYFVMDYVHGDPLDAYLARLDAARPETTATIVELFARIADAIHCAHLRGVIHRDLKPGNVRVDASGSPQVLDFGLAKLSASEAGASMTEPGQFVGTLPWASPEQALGKSTEVDVRSDVYSIGVMLYYALAQRMPYVTEGSAAAIANAIATAAPRSLRRERSEISQDLDTIVLKCLQKEPARRYQSAGDLARDLRRLQAGEPIEARRDSVVYLFQKAVARHRTFVMGAAAYAALATVGLLALLAAWRQAQFDRDAARDAERQQLLARTAADEARQAEAQQRAKADEKSAESQAVRDFLEEMLKDADPAAHGGKQLTVREALDLAARKLERGESSFEPSVEASLRATLGETYNALGVYDASEAHHRRALELRRGMHSGDHIEVAHSLGQCALAAQQLGKLDEAKELAESSVAMYRALGNTDSEAFAEVINQLARILRLRGETGAALPYFEQALAIRRRLFGDRSHTTAASINNIALAYSELGRLADAEPRYREAVEIFRARPSETVNLAAALNNLAGCLTKLGKHDDAAAAYGEAQRIVRELRGATHPETLTIQSNLALVLRKLGRDAEAEPMLVEVLNARRDKLGPTHPEVATSLNNLALLLGTTERLDQAIPLFREALAIREQSMNPGHPQIAQARLVLGRALSRSKQFEEGRAILESAYEMVKDGGAERAKLRKLIVNALVEHFESSGDEAAGEAWRRMANFE